VNGPQFASLAAANLRAPASWSVDDLAGTASFTWEPPLTPAEQATFADLQVMANFGVTLNLTEWQAIKADAAGLRAYLGVASPTAAQTASATKAIIRVLAVIIRD
jgi:2-keto-3-deoxy-6-phosphogluconate aldolase